ncbi:transcriptional repressor LexA [Chloroflexota bacterium]
MRKTYDRAKILEFIGSFIDENGYSPTIGEIQRRLSISSKSVVDRHLNTLEKEGYIKRNSQVTRGIDVSGIGKRTRTVPLLGSIAAGQPIPIPTEETWHSIALDTVDVPADFLPSGSHVYALQVRGTSMIDALVDDGDIVVLDAVNSVDDGEMVAAWLMDREETTLKKFYREKGRIRLQPANQTMEPIYIDPNNIQIQGKVVAVLRKIRR